MELKEGFERELAYSLVEDTVQHAQLKERVKKIDKMILGLALKKSLPKHIMQEYLNIITETPITNIVEEFTLKTLEWNLTKED